MKVIREYPATRKQRKEAADNLLFYAVKLELSAHNYDKAAAKCDDSMHGQNRRQEMQSNAEYLRKKATAERAEAEIIQQHGVVVVWEDVISGVHRRAVMLPKEARERK